MCICIRYGSRKPSTSWRYMNIEIHVKLRKKKNWIFVLKKVFLMKWYQINCVFNLLFLSTLTRFFFKFVLIWGHVATTVFIICKVRAILLLNTQNSISMKNEWTDIIKTYNKRGRVIRNKEILYVIMKVWHTSISFIFSFRNI